MAVRTAEDLFARCSPEPNSGCWLWAGGLAGNGYPMVWFGKKVQLATRVSWTLLRGPIPSGLDVLHKCDNPPCVNPDHLFLGTHLDNIRDMDRKGRRKTVAPTGEAQGLSVLTESGVLDIKRRLALKERHRDIASIYGVDRSTITQINRGITWKEVT